VTIVTIESIGYFSLNEKALYTNAKYVADFFGKLSGAQLSGHGDVLAEQNLISYYELEGIQFFRSSLQFSQF